MIKMLKHGQNRFLFLNCVAEIFFSFKISLQQNYFFHLFFFGYHRKHANRFTPKFPHSVSDFLGFFKYESIVSRITFFFPDWENERSPLSGYCCSYSSFGILFLFFFCLACSLAWKHDESIIRRGRRGKSVREECSREPFFSTTLLALSH